MDLCTAMRNMKATLLCLMVNIVFYSCISVFIIHLHKTETKDIIRNKTVLVTGGAGFIGYHLASELASKLNHEVIVMDNFNDYYSVKLKIDRAFLLHKKGVKIYAEDLCHTEFLAEMFQRYKFTHVVHLAAQAGVRYSLQNPAAYVKANVECYLSLSTVLQEYRDTHLVYASSSSVYGKEADVPFVLSAPTDHPGNMYAATKKTDELLGLHYCHRYNITTVGLRFFTVYGPWGRPDMSFYKFAEAIMNRRKIPMYHISDNSVLSRDFTYIDDIVSGILSAMDYEPKTCGENFNLGYGHPVSVPKMIEIMEENFGVTADIDQLPLPPSEILKTWADISISAEILGFKPKIDLSTGMQKFVSWYKTYSQQQTTEKLSGKASESELWFAR